MAVHGQKVVATLFRREHLTDFNAAALSAFIGALKAEVKDEDSSTSYELKVLDADRVVSITFSSAVSLDMLRKRDFLAPMEQAYGFDIVIQHYFQGHRSIKLAVFDMDSTLIQQEVIDLLAAHAGVEAAVADITSRAMNGELDFSASLRERVGLLNGIPTTVFEQLRPQLTLTPGADILLKCLRATGAKSALLSGGFMPLATFIAGRLGIDHVHANELAAEDSKLTGALMPGCIIVNAERKRELLKSIASAEGVRNSDEIMSVGDGANDLLMLGEAGLGIAVNAKPRVQQLAPYRLNCKSLVDVLHLLGYTSQEIDNLST